LISFVGHTLAARTLVWWCGRFSRRTRLGDLLQSIDTSDLVGLRGRALLALSALPDWARQSKMRVADYFSHKG